MIMVRMIEINTIIPLKKIILILFNIIKKIYKKHHSELKQC